MSLTPEQAERYRRSLLLPEVGEEGQARLAEARALVVGAGGLGSAAALYLAASGIGRLGIVDKDRVELSNLQRQILHRTADVGRAKAGSAARALRALNPEIEVVPYPVAVSEANAAELVSGYDVVVDAVDNLAARYLVNDACVRARRPLIEAGVSGTGGYLTTFLPDGRPCYRCLFPEAPALAAGGPEAPAGAPVHRAAGGILPTVPGVVGVLQATETLKVLLGSGATLAGRLLYVDLWTNEFRLVATAAAPGCPICGNDSEPLRQR